MYSLMNTFLILRLEFDNNYHITNKSVDVFDGVYGKTSAHDSKCRVSSDLHTCFQNLRQLG